MSFLVILGTISTATTVLTKHVFTTIKSHHTFNQTHKIYTQTTEKVLFFKITFFQPQPQQLQQKQTLSKYNCNKIEGCVSIKLVLVSSFNYQYFQFIQVTFY
jgi:ABC-type multidrug transport system fused ATPase/permease subunit